MMSKKTILLVAIVIFITSGCSAHLENNGAKSIEGTITDAIPKDPKGQSENSSNTDYDFSQEDEDIKIEEEKIKWNQSYSTIIVNKTKDGFGMQEIEALRNSYTQNGNMQTSKITFTPNRVVRSTIYASASTGELYGSSLYLYNIISQKHTNFLSDIHTIYLENNLIASGFHPNTENDAVYWSEVDIEMLEKIEKEDKGEMLSEYHDANFSVLEKLISTDKLLLTSYLLFDGLEPADVQLDFGNEGLSISEEYIRRKAEESDFASYETEEEIIEKAISAFQEVYAQSTYFDVASEKYYVIYGVSNYMTNVHIPLRLAVFSKNGDFEEVIVYEDIQNIAVYYSLYSYKPVKLDDGTVVFLDNGSNSNNSLLFDPRTREMTELESESILLENGYYYGYDGLKETIPIPPFTIEQGESEATMIIKLNEDNDQFVEMPSDYYLVDWEETEDGFNAIFGYMKSYYGDRSEEILKYDIAQQPWDYRYVVE